MPLPTIKIGVGEAKDPGEVSVLIQILFLLTILSLAPAILIMMTSFTRLIVVFSFLRHALGTQQMPPNQILIGLSLFPDLFHHDPGLVRRSTKMPGPLPGEEDLPGAGP